MSAKDLKAKKEDPTKRQWHRLDYVFREGEGIQPAVINDVPIFIPGKLNRVPVVMVPMSASPDQILAIAKSIRQIMKSEPLVVTSNVRFLRLVPISDEEMANNIREAEEDKKAHILAAAKADTEGKIDARIQQELDGPETEASAIADQAGTHVLPSEGEEG